MNPLVTLAWEAVASVVRNARNFSGRANRPEFWWFALFAFVVNIIAGAIPGASWIVPPVLGLLILAVGVRRLHDTGRSGWWIALLYVFFLTPIVFLLGLVTPAPLMSTLAWFGLVALIAAFAALALLALPGTRGPNRYGPDPSPAEPVRERPYTPLWPPNAAGHYRIGQKNKKVISIAVVVAVAVVAVWALWPVDYGEQVELAALLAMAENGQFTSITVDGDRLIAVQRQNNQTLTATMEPGTSIFESLQSAGINPVESGFEVEVQQRSDGLEYLLPLLYVMMLVGVLFILGLLISRRR